MDDFLHAEPYRQLLKEVTLDSQKYNDNQLMLLPGRVYGFVLRNRKWGELVYWPMEIITINTRLQCASTSTL